MLLLEVWCVRRRLVAGVLTVLLATATSGCAATVAAASAAPPGGPPAAPDPPRPAVLHSGPGLAVGPAELRDTSRRPGGPPSDPRVLARVRPPTAAATGDDGRPTVALTIDDGPDPVWTPQILALLRSYGDVATFCMIGRSAAARPDLVREVVAAGMRLCDHTTDHDQRLRSRPPAVLDREVTGAQTVLRTISQAPVPYYRSPGGGWSPAQDDLALADGMQPLGWSIDPQDWRRPNADAIVARVQRGLRPGDIVLLHDGGGDRSRTVAALQRLLPWLRDAHYRTVFPTP